MSESKILELMMTDIRIWERAWELYNNKELRVKPKDTEGFIAHMLVTYSVDFK